MNGNVIGQTSVRPSRQMVTLTTLKPGSHRVVGCEPGYAIKYRFDAARVNSLLLITTLTLWGEAKVQVYFTSFEKRDGRFTGLIANGNMLDIVEGTIFGENNGELTVLARP